MKVKRVYLVCWGIRKRKNLSMRIFLFWLTFILQNYKEHLFMVLCQGSKQPVGVHRWQKKNTRLEPQLSHFWICHVTPSRHSHVQWRGSNEVSCLCCFLLVMSECNLGDIILTFSHVMAAECQCWLRHLSVVNVTVCTHSRPAETSAAGEFAKPNWEVEKRWGEGRGEGGINKVCWQVWQLCLFCVQSCSIVCVGQVLRLDRPEWTNNTDSSPSALPNQNSRWAGFHLCLQYIALNNGQSRLKMMIIMLQN